MKHDDLQELLSEFTAGRLALLQRHEAAARAVSHYDFNNAYQYVISREETHITWLQDALADLGAALPPEKTGDESVGQTEGTPAVPEVPKTRKTVDPGAPRGVLEADIRYLRAFVDRWRDRVERVSNARHRTMLNVILGETLEHQRIFEQAASGFEDVLGRRTGGVARVGGVLPTRWIE